MRNALTFTLLTTAAALQLGCSGDTIIIVQQVADTGAPQPPAEDAAAPAAVDAGTPAPDAAVDAGAGAADATVSDAGAPDATVDAAPVDAGWTWDASQVRCNRYVILEPRDGGALGVGRILDTRSGLHWQVNASPTEVLKPGAEAYCASKNGRLPTLDEAYSIGNFTSGSWGNDNWCEGTFAWIWTWVSDAERSLRLVSGNWQHGTVPQKTLCIHR